MAMGSPIWGELEGIPEFKYLLGTNGDDVSCRPGGLVSPSWAPAEALHEGSLICRALHVAAT